MINFLDDFLELGFGKPMNIKFNNYTLDMQPSNWKKTESGYTAVCRTIGIDSKDVELNILENGISVKGKTEYDGYTYDVSYDIPVSKDVINNIKSITYKTLNGLTYIHLEIVRPEKSKIKISKID